MKRRLLVPSAVLLAGILGGCAPHPVGQPVDVALSLSSATLAAGAFPDGSTCKGRDTSPQLSWSPPPTGTRSLALIMADEDKLVGHLNRHPLVHWLAFDLPADARALTADQPKGALAQGGRQGRNDLGETGYTGPCPDAGLHHYAITVYALDRNPELPADTDGRALLRAIDGHILAAGRLVASYAK